MADPYGLGGFASRRSEKRLGRTIPNNRWKSQAAEARTWTPRARASLSLAFVCDPAVDAILGPRNIRL